MSQGKHDETQGGGGGIPQVSSDSEEVNFPIAYSCVRPAVPYNCTAGILVIITNSLIIAHFFKKRGRFVPCMYVLLSLFDTLTVLMMCGRDGVMEGFLYKMETQSGDEIDDRGLGSRDRRNPGDEPGKTQEDAVEIWVAILFTTFFSIFLRLSAFTNMVFSVARTIKIVSPFTHVSLRGSVIAILSYTGFWVIVAAVDLYFLEEFVSGSHYPVLDLFILHSQSGTGISKAADQSDSGTINNMSDVISISIMIISYLVPVLVSLVSCCTLLYTLNKSGDAPSTESARKFRQVSMTVIWLTGMFLVFIGTSTVYYCGFMVTGFMVDGDNATAMRINQYLRPVFFTSFPLVNAIFSPLIIIYRSKDLKDNIFGCCKGDRENSGTGGGEVSTRM